MGDKIQEKLIPFALGSLVIIIVVLSVILILVATGKIPV